MSRATTQTVRHPGQWTSRFVESPSSASLNVKKRGLLHRGQLKFSPPTVIDSLDRVKQIIAVHGFVNSTLDFDGQAGVMNGASDLMVEVFGEAGKHTRTAVGVAGLPLGYAASVYVVVELE